MMFNLRHHLPRRRPTGSLVEKALVPPGRFVTVTPHRSQQQFRHILLQVLVDQNTDGILHAPAFQLFPTLWLGKCGVISKRHFLAQLLLLPPGRRSPATAAPGSPATGLLPLGWSTCTYARLPCFMSRAAIKRRGVAKHADAAHLFFSP